MKLFKYKIFMFSALFLALAWSCEIEEGTEGAVTPQSLYSTENGVEKGINGLYGLYKKNINSGNLWKDKIIHFMGADDLTTIAGGNKAAFRMGDLFKHDKDDPWLFEFWKGSYIVINACNEFIEYVDPTLFDSTFYNYAIGNARFLRGIMYFDLIQAYEKIPLVLEKEIDHTIEPSYAEEVLNLVISDLEFASKWVINNRDVNANGPSTIDGHASRTAARAFLAKAHMALAGWPVRANYDQNWLKVHEYTKEIIDEGVYSLLDDYTHNFGNVGTTEQDVDLQEWEGNKEAVWSRIANESAYGTHGRFNGLPWNLWEDFQMEWHFYEKMPDNYRTDYTVTADSNWSYWGFTKYPYPASLAHPIIMKFNWGVMQDADYFAYKGVDELPPGDYFPGFETSYDLSNDVAIIRFAEVLLMYAEACARTGLDVDDGIEKLNWVRRRAYAGGLPAVRDTIDRAISAGVLTREYWKNSTPAVDFTQTTTAEIIDAVLEERAFEFVAELGGVRWFDLTRMERVASAMSDRISDSRELPLEGDPANPDNWRFPIPEREFSYNENLDNE